MVNKEMVHDASTSSSSSLSLTQGQVQGIVEWKDGDHGDKKSQRHALLPASQTTILVYLPEVTVYLSYDDDQ